MLGQVVAAQFDLERSIAELPGGARSESEQQLRALKSLQQQIGRASPDALKTMRTVVSDAIATARTTVQQGRVSATAESLAIVAEAASASRQQVTAIMRDMHRFDPYLRFGSAEDEAAYRQREADRRAAIEADQAKHTPQGDLNAAASAIGQMVDAKAHGADKSPAFHRQWDDLVDTTTRLRDAVHRSGGDTAEFDNRLRADLRAILKSKGLDNAQIDARFVANSDPLEAAEAFVRDSRDLDEVRRSAERARAMDIPIADATLDDASKLVASMSASAIAGGGAHEGPPVHGVANRLGATGRRVL